MDGWRILMFVGLGGVVPFNAYLGMVVAGKITQRRKWVQVCVAVAALAGCCIVLVGAIGTHFD